MNKYKRMTALGTLIMCAGLAMHTFLSPAGPRTVFDFVFGFAIGFGVTLILGSFIMSRKAASRQ